MRYNVIGLLLFAFGGHFLKILIAKLCAYVKLVNEE